MIKHELKYYCNDCRDITIHVIDSMNIICHRKNSCQQNIWCNVCGEKNGHKFNHLVKEKLSQK